MNMKKTVKKITAVLTGATMLGATIMGAAAMDLGDYPEPLIVDGVLNGKIVIGEHADPTDVMGSIDLAANLQQYSRVPISVGAGEVSVVEGAEELDLFLNTNSGAVTLDKDDIEGLREGTLRWNSTDIDYEEHIILKDGALSVKTNSETEEEDYGMNAFLNVMEETVHYRFLFTDEKPTPTEARPLTITVLGREMRIIDYDADNDGITLESAYETFMEVGDTVEVDGYNVEMVNVGENAVRIKVDGSEKVIQSGQSEEFDGGEFTVEVQSIFFISGAEDNGAQLKLGEDITRSVRNEESMELFGEPSSTAEAEWLWDINVTGNGIAHIGAMNNIRRDLVYAEYDDERPALGVGEYMSFPNDFAEVLFDGFYDTRHNEIRMSFRENRRLYAEEGAGELTERLNFLQFTSDKGDNVFELEGRTKRSTEYYVTAIGVAVGTIEPKLGLGYLDGDDAVIMANHEDLEFGHYDWQEEFKIALQRSQDEVTVRAHISMPNSDGEPNPGLDNFPDDGNEDVDFWVAVKFGDQDQLYFHLDRKEIEFASDVSNANVMVDGFDRFGKLDREAERRSLYHDTKGAIGHIDYDMMLSYGVKFEEPEYQLDRDRFNFLLPYERAEARIIVKTEHSSVIGGGTGGDAYETVPIAGDLSLSDREAMALIGEVPLLVVGGPNANTVAAELLEVDQFSAEVGQYFTQGKAMIKLFEEKNAILVAGYGAKDTRAASLALANEDNWPQFAGHKEVELTIPATTVTSIVGVN